MPQACALLKSIDVIEQCVETTGNLGGSGAFPSERKQLRDTSILLRWQKGSHAFFFSEVLLHHMEMAHVQLRSAIMLHVQRPVGGHAKTHSNRLSPL